MVGEFALLTDISSICQWTNTLLITMACIPVVLFPLLYKLVPRRGSELFKLEWNQDYFERGFLTSVQPEDDSQQSNRVEDGEDELQVPGVEDHQQTVINKQTT
jgi:hypothetical protein